MSTNKLNQHKWEPWQLTAYVLGELESDLSAQIELESARNVDLAKEISAIRSAVEEVKSVLVQEKSDSPARVNFDSVFAQADQVHREPRSQIRIASSNEHKVPRSRRFAWLPLLAMSACLLLAFVLSVPQVSKYMLATNDHVNKDAGNSGGSATVAIPLGQSEDTSDARPASTSVRSKAEATVASAGEPESVGLAAPVQESLGARQAIVAEKSNLSQNGQESAQMLGIDSSGGLAGGQSRFGAQSSSDSTLAIDQSSSGVSKAVGMPAAETGADSNFLGRSHQALGIPLAEGDRGARRDFQNDSLTPHYDDGPARVRTHSTDRYQDITENPFERTGKSPLSTFSIDVDTASYAKTRQFLFEANQLPPKDAVRIEEFINYFDYEYPRVEGDKPFEVGLSVASCPWKPEHRLVRIALQAAGADMAERAKANIVFLLDVSGSMDAPNRLPLVKESMRMLIEQLNENDKVAMVVYAGSAGCVLESTSGNQQATILSALDRLRAGGSTNGGEGIQLAYKIARENFIEGGINRVILCTDGDFNVGTTSDEALVDLVSENARSKVFLTLLGFGMGNTNDSMMEQISGRGNGVYGFVDSWREAKRQMVQQVTGNLITIAKDVKLQVEFNPQHVAAYRLLGYENRILAAEDFNNDAKDAGDIGAGHRVTALYEIVPVGVESNQNRPLVDDLRYQPKREAAAADLRKAELPDAPKADQPGEALRHELLAVKIRYKQPEGSESKLLVFPLDDQAQDFAQADRDLRWAASMAEFGMLLRGSQYSGSATWSQLIQQAKSAAGNDPSNLQEECLQMIERASQLSR